MVLEVKYTFNLFSDTFLNIAIYTHIWFYKPFFGPYYRSLYPWRCNTWWIQGWSIKWNISLQMSQAVYHNKWQKMYCKGKWESSWWGLLLLPLKRFLHISSVWKMELQEDSISSCTQHLYVCLFFFIMNKTSYKKVVVQLFSLQNVSRIFFLISQHFIASLKKRMFVRVKYLSKKLRRVSTSSLHSVEIQKMFSHSYFPWNQFLQILSCKNCHFDRFKIGDSVRASMICQNVHFWESRSSEIDLTEKSSGRKILQFPHCAL